MDMPEQFEEDQEGYEKWCDDRDLLAACKGLLRFIDREPDLHAIFVTKDSVQMGVFRAAIDKASRSQAVTSMQMKCELESVAHVLADRLARYTGRTEPEEYAAAVQKVGSCREVEGN